MPEFAQSATADMHAPAPALLAFRRDTLHLERLRFDDDGHGAAGNSTATRKRHLCCPSMVPPGVVSLDWLGPNPAPGSTATVPASSKTICVLVPGLTGSSEAAYMQRFAVALSNAGVHSVCYNPRGRGGNALTTPFLYSAGYTEVWVACLTSVGPLLARHCNQVCTARNNCATRHR